MKQPAPTISALLSVQDAVFPAHPFSGVLAIAREQDWRWQDMFPAFAEHHDNRISYTQAREGLLQARHRGGADLGLRSGTRKALPQLGQMAAGMRAQPTLAEALQFGLDYQLIAGSMVHLQLEAGPQQSALLALPLFDDAELQDFLEVDHLVTAINAARQLCGRRFPLVRVELRLQPGASLTAYEKFFACPVIAGADVSRIVIDNQVLQMALPQPDALLAHTSHDACQAELAAVGVLGRQSLLRTLTALQCELHSVAQTASVLGTSERSLHRLLAREGTSYFQITETIRIGRARQLLQTGLSLERIAEELGYSDSRSFRRAFRRWTTQTPAEFRQSQAQMQLR